MIRQTIRCQPLCYREEVQPHDREVVRDLIASSDFFSQEEVEIAVELVDTRLAQGQRSGYEFIFAEHRGDVLGYACFGPIPATAMRYDLYWIAVRQPYRNMGVGANLLRLSEQRIVEQGGQRLYVETSSRPLYAPTHAFYQRHGYHQEAILHDYYAPGDSKVIYVKLLPADRST